MLKLRPGQAFYTTTENGTVDVIHRLVTTKGGGKFLSVEFRVHDNGYPVEQEEASAIVRELLEAHRVPKVN